MTQGHRSLKAPSARAADGAGALLNFQLLTPELHSVRAGGRAEWPVGTRAGFGRAGRPGGGGGAGGAMAEGSAVSDPQHAARLLRALSSFREEARFCDAHLVLDGEEIPVQKNILAAASPYIR